MLIYTLSIGQSEYVFLQVIFAALIPAILPIVSYATKEGFPLFLNLLFSIHIILAVDLGCAMSFYDRFYWWDMLMHGCFGLIASMSFYILLLKWNEGNLKRFGFFALIFLSTKRHKHLSISPLRSAETSNQFLCLTSQISSRDVELIHQKARESGATMNDVFMTAYARVIAQLQNINTVVLPCPADLRRFYPELDALLSQI